MVLQHARKKMEHQRVFTMRIGQDFKSFPKEMARHQWTKALKKDQTLLCAHLTESWLSAQQACKQVLTPPVTNYSLLEMLYVSNKTT